MQQGSSVTSVKNAYLINTNLSKYRSPALLSFVANFKFFALSSITSAVTVADPKYLLQRHLRRGLQKQAHHLLRATQLLA